MSTTTAAEIRQALLTRWPDSEYLTIVEAPDGPDRTGRKLDLLVVSLWRSRGYELDGVEIKVSASDWKRELDNAAKADWWWRHVHRFWIAVPVALAPKVRNELPTGWGLLACSTEPGAGGKRTQVLVKPEKHDPEPMTWPNVVGLLRASADSGVGALQRAEERGYDRGHQVAKREAELAELPIGGNPGGRLEELRARVNAFEQASGLKISNTDSGRVGRLVALVEKATHDPEWTSRTVQAHATRLTQTAQELTALAQALAVDLAPREPQRTDTPAEAAAG